MRYVFLLLFTVLTFNLFGQKYKTAFENIENKDFEKAIKILTKSKKKSPVVYHYGNALIFSHPDFKQYNPARAYRHTKYALKRFELLKSKEPLQKKYNINKKILSDLQNQIARNAYAEMPDKNNINNLNEYIIIFSQSNIIEDITKKRDSIVYSNVLQSNDFNVYKTFVRKYPKAKQVPEALQQIDKLWRQKYENILQSGELIPLEEFEYQYPNFPYYSEYSSKHKIIAQRGMNLNLASGYIPELHPKYQKFIKDAAPKDIAFAILQSIVNQDIKTRNYEQAIDTLLKYEVYFSQKPEAVNKFKKLLQTPIKNFEKPKLLPGLVNTSGWEYSASVTADDKQIVFCGRSRDDNLAKGLEDIFYARKNSQGTWEKATPIDELNTKTLNEAPLFISADGTQMLIFSEGNIFISNKTAQGWGQKRIFPKINKHEAWEADAMLTADGNAVFFISDREYGQNPHVRFGKKYHGGMAGNTDIYVSVKKNDQWSEPINIGKTINTPYAERSPFLHPDMKTLYFSSDGHVGLGAKDVFMSKRLNDTSWTQWSEPVNLGKSINTQGDEWGYKISGDGIKAYFSRFEDNTFNIYETTLPKEFRPETTTRISGILTNTENEILEGQIVWEDLTSGKKIGHSNSDPENGQYIINLPNGKNYGFYVETPGYYPVSGNIDLTKVKIMQDKEKNFILTSINKIIQGEKAIPLENIFFEYDSYTLKKESQPELKRLVIFLQKHKDIKIEIGGHTDNQGSEQYNIELSQKRATTIADYITNAGFPKKSITVKGYGANRPKADNNTEEGRAKNRRVEFKVLP